MPSEIKKTSLGDFVAELEAALETAHQFGLHWRGGRYDEYLRVLRKVANLPFPAQLPFPRGSTEHTVLFHGASQARLLIDSRAIWGDVEADILAQKLQRVLSGAPLPSDITRGDHTDDDHARNILAEFSVATMLKSSGARISMTNNDADADLVAEWPSLAPFVIECKRPVRGKTLIKNLKKIREKLKRCQVTTSGRFSGFAIAGDRVLNLDIGTPLKDTSDSLRAAIQNDARALVTEINRASARPEVGLLPFVDIAFALLVGSAFVGDLGIVVTMNQVGAFFPRGDHDVVSRSIHAALGPMIPDDVSS